MRERGEGRGREKEEGRKKVRELGRSTKRPDQESHCAPGFWLEPSTDVGEAGGSGVAYCCSSDDDAPEEEKVRKI